MPIAKEDKPEFIMDLAEQFEDIVASPSLSLKLDVDRCIQDGKRS